MDTERCASAMYTNDELLAHPLGKRLISMGNSTLQPLPIPHTPSMHARTHARTRTLSSIISPVSCAGFMDEHGADAIAAAMQRMLCMEDRSLKQQGNTDRDLDDILDYLCGPPPEWSGAAPDPGVAWAQGFGTDCIPRCWRSRVLKKDFCSHKSYVTRI